MRVVRGSAVATLALALLAACSSDEGLPKIEEPQRDTPLHLLGIFCNALEGGSLEDYTASLAPDYRFVFLERDWDDAGVTPGAPYWGKTLDSASTAAMFESAHLISISCDLDLFGQVACSDTLCQCVCDCDIQVHLDDGGGPVTYWVNQSWLNFKIVRDPLDTDLWVIREIEEEEQFPLEAGRELPVRSAAAVESSTFGSIKAMFR